MHPRKPMKKLFLYALGVAALVTSCNKSESSITKSDEVTFTSKINSLTTRVSETLFDEGDVIGVFAEDGGSLYANNVAYTFADGKFSSLNNIEYNDVDQQLSFSATYPLCQGASISEPFLFTIAEDQTSAKAYEASDLITATTEPTSEACPDLQFFHRMAAIQINVVDNDATVSDVAVQAKNNVLCNIKNNTYTVSGDATSIAAAQLSEVSYTAIIAPQTIYANDDFVTLNINGQAYTWSLANNANVESGYKYVINVTVEGGAVTFSGEIEPWVAGGDLNGGFNEDGGDDADANSTAFELGEITHNSIQIIANPGSNVENYVAGLCIKRAYEGYFGNDPVTAAKGYLDLLSYKELDLTVADNVNIFNGPATFYLSSLVNNILPDTGYYVFLFAVDSEGNVDTNFEVTVKEIVTPLEAYQFVDGYIDIKVESVDVRDVYADFTRVDYDRLYFIGEVSVDELNADFNGDITACAEYYVEQETQYNTDPILVETGFYIRGYDLDNYNVSDLYWPAEYTDYVIFAAGINSNGDIITKVTSANMTTGGY